MTTIRFPVRFLPPAVALAAFLVPARLAAAPAHTGTVQVHLVTLNDFHGHIVQDRTITVNGKKVPVGGAAYLATMIHTLKSRPNTLLVDAGDMVGASPPTSALFKDEPTVEWMNKVGFDVGALGNHEFDGGLPEMLRLWHGGSNLASLHYPKAFSGVKFPVLCSNVVYKSSGQFVFPPSFVKRVQGVPIGFIGAVTNTLPTIVRPDTMAQLRVLDAATAINAQAALLRKHGVHAFVVLIHEGGKQTPEEPGGQLVGNIVEIAGRLDPDIQMIVSAHTHNYTNTFIGKRLITQSRWAGAAIGEVDLTLDRASGGIVHKTARILDTTHDGIAPEPGVAALVDTYVAAAAPRVNRVVGTMGAEMKAPHQGDYETLLGDLIADAQREAAHADIALMNPGGIRQDLPAGQVSWGQIYSVQPFGNQVMLLKMTGAQIKGVLEQQWGPGQGGQPHETILQVSGLSYTYTISAPYGQRLADVNGPDGQPLKDDAVYTVAANNFLAGGGDEFTRMKDIQPQVPGPSDLDALINYIKAHPGIVPALGRIRATS